MYYICTYIFIIIFSYGRKLITEYKFIKQIFIFFYAIDLR